MADLALLTPSPSGAGGVLPALELLPHRLRILPLDAAALLHGPAPSVVLVDATRELVPARSTVRALHAMQLGLPVVGVFSEGGLTVVDEQWPLTDLVVSSAQPAEVEARLRLAVRARRSPGPEAGGPLRVADVVVDEDSWTVRAGGRPLDLTYKEFELLRYLLQHPGRVVTREQLLQEVWGMDYYGGTRTVDVHVRRLRAKLGPERESLIGTVRNVGYRFAATRPGENAPVVE